MLSSCSAKLNNLAISQCFYEELRRVVHFVDGVPITFNFVPFPSIKPNENKSKLYPSCMLSL